MKTEKSTRELAMKWWDNLTSFQRSYFKDLHLESTRSLLSLTGREIEEIWRKETQLPYCEKHTCNNVNCNTGCKELKYKDKPNQKQFIGDTPIAKMIDETIHPEKYNSKQFKEFNPELFKSYIEKFSDEDKIKAFNILISFEKVRWYMIEELSK